VRRQPDALVALWKARRADVRVLHRDDVARVAMTVTFDELIPSLANGLRSSDELIRVSPSDTLSPASREGH
jgi:hypothetical protein